jgi:Kdo2-lipid IVA lauroyltransferase/acyltransferase
MGSAKTAGISGAAVVTFRHSLEYLGLRVAGWIVCLLPYRWLLWISKPLGSLVFLLDSRGRAVAMANLTSAYGGTMDDSDKRRVAREGYRSFARTMLELFWSPNVTPAFAAKTFRTRGLPGAPHGTPCIYVTIHYGNFEWLGLNAALHLGPGIVVAQKLGNPLLGAYFSRLRGVTGHASIPQRRSIARMLAHLRSGGYFCALVDLNLDPKEASVIIEQFGGLKTCVTQIHSALALHTGARIIPAACHPLPDGTYAMHYHKAIEYPPDASPQSIAQQCWDVLEPSVRANPAHWLWSYKHWRFKPSGDDSRRYPFYANRAGRFDRALARQHQPKDAP